MTFASLKAHFGFVQPGPRDIGVAVRAIDVIEKREEDLVVGREMRIEHHVEHADVLCAGRRQVGHPGHGLREHAVLVSRMRRLPGSLSVRRIFPSGRNARLQGAGRLSISVVTLEGRRRVIGRAGLLGECGLVVAFFRRADLDRLTIHPGRCLGVEGGGKDHQASPKSRSHFPAGMHRPSIARGRYLP